VHEVDQSPDRLLLCDPHAPPSERRRRGGERRTTPIWVSSDDLRRAASGGIRVRAHALVVRSRLVARRCSQKMLRSGRVDVGSLRRDPRARCLPRGDSYVDLLLWPRICLGVP
jgi:hypothetical protein